MKYTTTFLLLITLCLPGYSQTDSLNTALPVTDTSAVDGLEGRSLELSLGANGAAAKVSNPYDTALTGMENDTIRITTKRKKITIITTPKIQKPLSGEALQDSIRDAEHERKMQLARWAGLDLGINYYINADGAAPDGDDFMALDIANSRFFSINFLELKYEFGTPHFGLLTGAGIEFTSYKLDNNVTLAFNSDSTYALMTAPDSTGMSTVFRRDGLTKNKLRQIGLRVPFMLEFNTSKIRKRSFHLGVGLIGTIYFDNMYKQKFTNDGDRIKARNNGSYNLSPYRLSATARFGYGGLNLFAEVGLTELFDNNKGPELYPVNLGITLVSF
jgi:hypothetical protein